VNEWLLIPLTVIAFVLVACAILAICFGAWVGAHTILGRIVRTAPFGRLRRTS
jgi:hypothetical protein